MLAWAGSTTGVSIPESASAIYELIKVLPEAAFLLSEKGEVLAAPHPRSKLSEVQASFLLYLAPRRALVGFAFL